MTKQSAEEMLSEDIAGFFDDPLGYVMYMFPWDTGVIDQVELQEPWASRYGCKFGPDKWACELLEDLAEDIKERAFDGRTAEAPIQYSTASGHGIGKSVMVAWLIKFIMDTRPLSKGVVTAGTVEQLKTKTWAELGKWNKLSLTRHWYDFSSGRGSMAMRHKEWAEEWFVTAQTCREENSEAFAGQHAANATSFYIFDEASQIAAKIFEVREGGATDGEPMVFDFGNPTRNTGRFFENMKGKQAHRFNVRFIDSRDVAITNKDRIQEWIDDWGEDSDYVRVRVRGEFPKAGSHQYIPSNYVQLAVDRPTVVDRYAPLIIGVDVARFGDDESVIYPRVGSDARTYPVRRFRGIDTVQLTGQVIEYIRWFKALGITCKGLFVDGGGIGGGVVDQLRSLGYGPHEVQFGGSPTDPVYRFKGDEMWGKMRDALRDRLQLPPIMDPMMLDLRRQLTQREYGYTLLGNKVHMESKRDMKQRLGGEGLSPDIADALALTFAADIIIPPGSNQPHGQQQSSNFAKSEYDPLDTNW